MPPKQPPHLVKSKRINMTLTAREHDLIKQLADRDHRSLAGLIRQWIRKEAKKAGITSQVK